MILTITLNPCVDNTFWVDDWDSLPVKTERQSGGKGINVARVLTNLSVPCLALAPAGGENGALLRELCQSERVPLVPYPIRGETRDVDTWVRRRDLEQRVDVHPSPEMTREECAGFEDLALSLLDRARAVAVCGSACCERAAQAGRRILEAAKERGVFTVLDSNKTALAVCSEAKPDLIKPNQKELAQLMGRDVAPEEEEEACEALLDRGIGSVLLSMGAGGAVFRSRGSQPVRAAAPRVETVNAVGSGDSFLAAWLHAWTAGASSRRALEWACAAGAANAAVFPAARVTRREIQEQAGFSL